MKKLVLIVLLIILSVFLFGEKIVPLPELQKPENIIIDQGQILMTEFPNVYVYSLEDFKLIVKFGKKEGNKRVFRRSLSIGEGERVLIVDDVMTTGGSIREVIDAVRLHKGDIIGIGILVDRTQEGIDFGFPLYSCLKAATTVYRPEDCPLCAAGVELTRPGGHS